MLFQTYYRLDPWTFEPPLDHFHPIRFDKPAELFSLYMRYTHAYSEEQEPEIMLQTVLRVDEIPDDVRCVFSGELEIDWFAESRIHNGSDALPKAYREFVINVHARMDQMATELFNVVRWRLGIVGGPLSLDSDWSSMRWHDTATNDEVLGEHGFLNRQIIAGSFTLDLPEMQQAGIDDDCPTKVDELLRLQSNQPLYHDLFREAWQNQRNNPRSSLVMAIAAAETAFKTTISDLNPSVTWIVENLPSPPLDRMLRDYMTQLPARNHINGEVRRPPKSTITVIKNGIELRNRLVHGREEKVSSSVVRTTLEAIRDLLYLLDFYRGHTWALERVSRNVVDNMNESQ